MILSPWLIRRVNNQSALMIMLVVARAYGHQQAQNLLAGKIGVVPDEVMPNDARALHSQGMALRAAGQFDQAVVCYRQALAEDPNFAEAHNSLGVVYHAQGKLEDAKASYQRAVTCDSTLASAHNNIGLICEHQGAHEKAITQFRQAIAIQPNFSQAHFNLSCSYRKIGNREQALLCLEQAIAFNQSYAKAYFNLGCLLSELKRFEPALAAFARAGALEPENAALSVEEGRLRLRLGDTEGGWPKYEARLAFEAMAEFKKPIWTDSDLRGKTIVLHENAGYGDTIQFIRYAALVKAAGARVIAVCQPGLVRLLGRMTALDIVVAEGQPLPEHDCHIPVRSLPSRYRTTLTTVPAEMPYVSADPRQVDAWAERLASFSGIKVGLVWSGNTERELIRRYPDLMQHELIATGRERNMALSTLMPVLRTRGVTFFSLQLGEPANQMKSVSEGAKIVDLTGDLRDFADTAALVSNLDLVIGVDTAVIHLAGALGKPVWLLSRFNGCWRWLENRDDSPWYPSLRVFRQSRPGDWKTPVAAVAKQLAGRRPPAR